MGKEKQREGKGKRKLGLHSRDQGASEGVGVLSTKGVGGWPARGQARPWPRDDYNDPAASLSHLMRLSTKPGCRGIVSL